VAVAVAATAVTAAPSEAAPELAAGAAAGVVAGAAAGVAARVGAGAAAGAARVARDTGAAEQVVLNACKSATWYRCVRCTMPASALHTWLQQQPAQCACQAGTAMQNDKPHPPSAHLICLLAGLPCCGSHGGGAAFVGAVGQHSHVVGRSKTSCSRLPSSSCAAGPRVPPPGHCCTQDFNIKLPRRSTGPQISASSCSPCSGSTRRLRVARIACTELTVIANNLTTSPGMSCSVLAQRGQRGLRAPAAGRAPASGARRCLCNAVVPGDRRKTLDSLDSLLGEGEELHGTRSALLAR
jgi:hypothetical protein